LNPNVAVLRPDGILHYDFRGDRIDLETAHALLEAGRVAMGDDVRPRPVLVQLHRATVDQAARRYLSFSKDQRAQASRVAMIASNPVSRVIGNFFVGLNRPEIPTRLFADEPTAVPWLLAPEGG
jgi:hypothetical protein